jgi:hypothetical protein
MSTQLDQIAKKAKSKTTVKGATVNGRFNIFTVYSSSRSLGNTSPRAPLPVLSILMSAGSDL